MRMCKWVQFKGEKNSEGFSKATVSFIRFEKYVERLFDKLAGQKKV